MVRFLCVGRSAFYPLYVAMSNWPGFQALQPLQNMQLLALRTWGRRAERVRTRSTQAPDNISSQKRNQLP